MDLFGLVSQFGGVVYTLIAFVAVLCVIISIHEYGHYIVGRWCGIHAEVFSLGFGPVLRSRVDRRGTKWQIALLPFGGYVKFLGDADGSSRSDPTTLAKLDPTDRARSFHGAPLFKRALTVAAGPIANFILSSAIFTALVLVSGLATDEPVIGAMKPLPDAGYSVKAGDRILMINGVEVTDYEALYEYARESGDLGPQTYRIERDDQTIEARGPFPLLPIVDSVSPRSAAVAAGLKVGDVILSVNGVAITAFRELQEIVFGSAGAPLNLEIWRAGDVINITLNAKSVDIPNSEGGFDQRVMIGIAGGLFFEPQTYTPGPLTALGLGATQTWRIITGSLNGLKHMVSGAISTCNLQGPVGIAQVSGDAASQGVESFIWFIAVLSTAIGLLNLFPIPVLDGGHLVLFGYEAIARKPPPEKSIRIMMMTGLALLLSLMAFALLNDFLCP